MSGVHVRSERLADYDAVRGVNLLAFGRRTEADLVDALRASCKEAVSFVAIESDAVVGHILFTPVTIEGTNIKRGMGLGPMAVLPEKQRMGIGSMLVREGLEKMCQAGCPYVIVLGHSTYYPRFGFVPASRYGCTCQWPGIPEEAFMILVFNKEVMEGIRGAVRYRTEFDADV